MTNFLNTELWEEGVSFGIQQRYWEFSYFCDLIYNNSSRNILVELGTHTGGTSSIFSKLFSRVITIDIKNWRDKELPSNCTPIIGDTSSSETISKVGTLLGKEKVDVLFIDAGHSYKNCKLDFQAYLPFVKNNGIVAFHDIVDSPSNRLAGCFVSKVWEETKTLYPYIEIKELPKFNCGIGMVYIREGE